MDGNSLGLPGVLRLPGLARDSEHHGDKSNALAPTTHTGTGLGSRDGSNRDGSGRGRSCSSSRRAFCGTRCVAIASRDKRPRRAGRGWRVCGVCARPPACPRARWVTVCAGRSARSGSQHSRPADLRQQRYGPTGLSVTRGARGVPLRAPSRAQTDHALGRRARQCSTLRHRPAVVAAHVAPAHNGENDTHSQANHVAQRGG